MKHNGLRYLISFLLPCLILVVVWMSLGLAPFGHLNLLVSDLGSQYLPFLTEFKRFFTEGGESLYSFSNGIGGPMEATIAYYLMSPFNFISLLFPYEQLPLAVLLMITIKIASMSTTMYYYLDKHYQTSDGMTYAFSVAYSFCGFVVVYLLNFMWLDVLILFPLLVLGLERLWKQQRYGLYAVTLFLSILTNYYLGYMVCIFAVGYSVFLYYLHGREPGRNSVLTVIKKWQLFLVTSLLTGLSTSFMLIPAILGMLETGKSSFHMQDFMPVPRFGLEVFSQMGLGTVNYDIRLDHLPMIYSGIFIWVLAFVYFTLPNVPHKKKKAMAGLLIFIYFSFFFEVINTVWHMFQSPAGFPYRNAFIFSFLLIKLAYETYLYAKEHENHPLIGKKLMLAGVVYTVLLSIGQFFLINHAKESYLLSNTYYVLSVAIIWLMIGLFRMSISRDSQILKVILLLFVSTELGLNLWISMKDIPFGNQIEYANMYKNQSAILKDLSCGQDELFRINQKIDWNKAGYSEINNGYNNPLLFGYPGVSSYTSTLDATVQDTLVELGLYGKNERRFSYVDESLVANLLLNVKYTISPKKIADKDVLEDKHHTTIYKNKEALGAGFLAPDSLKEVVFQPKKVIANQEQVLQNLLPLEEDDTYFHSLADIHITQRDHVLTLQGTVTHTGMTYLYVPQAVWDHVKGLSVNGHKISSDLFIITNQLFNLGKFQSGEQVHLEMPLSADIDTRGLEWMSLSDDRFNEVLSTYQSQAISLKWTRFGSLTGQVTVDKEHPVLYVSIPYDSNWVAKVDGKKVKTIPLLGDFMGINMTEGAHTVQLNYVSKSFWFGVGVSIITLLISIGCVFMSRKKETQ